MWDGFRESGFLPEALVNFVALLGWNPGDNREIMSMEELIRDFSFAHCSKSGARFDYDKAKWFNHEYLIKLDDAKLAEQFKPVLEAHGVNVADYSDQFLAQVVSLVKGRITFVKDLWDQSKFFFEAPEEYAEKDIKKRWKEDTPRIMNELCDVLAAIEDFGTKNQEEIVLGWISEHEYHLGNVMNAFRLAVVGECKGPHMFDITELIGKEETIARLRKAVATIGK